KEDMTYIRLDFTRNRVCSRSNTAYPADYIRRILLIIYAVSSWSTVKDPVVNVIDDI
ncbi:hypothetical protein Tco_0589649, partial [Tanacetum coccineum]